MSELPHDIAAEAALLGAILIRPDSLPGVAASIQPGDFHSQQHATLYRAILSLSSRGWPSDERTVAHELRGAIEKTHGTTPQRAAVLIGTLLNGVPRSVNAPYYAEIVKELSLKRNLIRFAAEVREAAQNGHNPDAVLQLVDAYVRTVKQRAASGSAQVQALDLSTVLEAIEREPIPWLIRGWLAENEMAYLAGEWGSGKSYVALDAAVSIAAGIPWMGKVDVLRAAPVLYVDEENGPALARHRMALICRGRALGQADAESLPIRYLTKNGISLDDASGFALIDMEIERSKAKVVVLDSLVRFFRGRDENDASSMAAFFGERISPLMARHRCSFLALDHMGKPSKERTDPGHRQRGSSEKPGNADELWALEGGRDTDRRTLSHQKTRWDDLSPSLSLRWCKSDDGRSAWIECGDERIGCEEAVRASLEIAAENGMRHGEIVAAMEARGFAVRHGRRTIGKLHGQGTLRRKSDGGRTVRYWLKEYAPAGSE